MESIKEMETQALEERKAQIAELAGTAAEEDLGALEDEIRAINAELEERRAAEAERRAEAKKVADGEGDVTDKKEAVERTKKMDEKEIRNSKQYIDAYAEYIKTGKADECRTLLTSNATGGTIPVPDFVYDIVQTAWEKDEITRRIRKAYLRGNLSVDVEISGTGASWHNEGSSGPSEETLVHGTITLIPKYVKKWITLTDEVRAMRGEEFLRYIYEELTYRIAEAIADKAIEKIIACSTVSTNTPTTGVAVAVVNTSTIGVGLAAEGLGLLQAGAKDNVMIMNRKTWSAFKKAQYAASYPIDPFEGMPVLYSNKLKAFDVATTGETFAIVGDLDRGMLANFPEGEDVSFIFDDVTLATDDKVKITGKEFLGLEVVNQNMFTKFVMA